jgi:stringent starvation protein A
MLTLYDADRCPYCARVRIVLAEKEVEYQTVTIDLQNRPEWLYDKNPLGKVPVIEEDAFVLPESEVIMEYLEERYPEPALMPADAAARARVRLVVHRFDTNLGDAYYAFRRGEDGAADRLAHCLSFMERGVQDWRFGYGLADIAYLPWLIRLRDLLGVELPARLAAHLDELAARPAIAAELEVVAALAA